MALLGFDQTTAEVLVNLITGATLPDSGEVDVFGVSTRNIGDPDAWLVEMDQFGIFSERAVLLEQFTVEQNLALPFTLEVEQLSESVRETVRALAHEVGIHSAQLSQSPAALDADAQLRVRLGQGARARSARPAGGTSQRHAACRGHPAIRGRPESHCSRPSSRAARGDG